MKNLIIAVAALSFSMCFAANVQETIRQVEIEKTANCRIAREGLKKCLHFKCWSKTTLACSSSEAEFRVILKVVTKTLANGKMSEEVTKVKF